MSVLLARMARSQIVRLLPRVLPITTLGTFLLTLGLCYHFYYDVSGRNHGRLYTISVYSVGPWNPATRGGAPNLVIFRVGTALVGVQGILLVGSLAST